MRKKKTRIEFQRVDVEYFKPLMAQMGTQKICESRISFDCENARAFLKDELGERA